MKSPLAILTAIFLLVGCAGQATTVDVVQSSTSSVSIGTTEVPFHIELTVGEDTGPNVVQTIAVGTSVQISITNEEDDDEYHLHGYDLGSGEVPAGETATIEFRADVPGSFELESHVSGEVLMTLVVE